MEEVVLARRERDQHHQRRLKAETECEAARKAGFGLGYVVAMATTYALRELPREPPDKQAYARSAGFTVAAPSSYVVTQAWERWKDATGRSFFRVEDFETKS